MVQTKLMFYVGDEGEHPAFTIKSFGIVAEIVHSVHLFSQPKLSLRGCVWSPAPHTQHSSCGIWSLCQKQLQTVSPKAGINPRKQHQKQGISQGQCHPLMGTSLGKCDIPHRQRRVHLKDSVTLGWVSLQRACHQHLSDVCHTK